MILLISEPTKSSSLKELLRPGQVSYLLKRRSNLAPEVSLVIPQPYPWQHLTSPPYPAGPAGRPMGKATLFSTSLENRNDDPIGKAPEKDSWTEQRKASLPVQILYLFSVLHFFFFVVLLRSFNTSDIFQLFHSHVKPVPGSLCLLWWTMSYRSQVYS